MDHIVLSTKSLTRRFGQTGKKSAPAIALDSLDFTVSEGEFTVVMGSSGSGKSTLLYLLAGLDRPTSGEVIWNELRIDNRSEKELALMRRKGFGFVFQQSQMIPSLSLRDNAAMPAHLLGMKPAEVSARVDELFADFGIGGLADRLPSQVSGGEAQRASIARALVNRPSVLLADEPTGALNHASGEAVLKCFTDIHRSGQTIVIVTHELRAAARGQRIVFLQDGKTAGELRFDTAMQLPAEREKVLFAWLSERGW
jgi:putative ABC transport system ATP-binding protein